jgi:hypothetical protein
LGKSNSPFSKWTLLKLERYSSEITELQDEKNVTGQMLAHTHTHTHALILWKEKKGEAESI